MKIVFCILGAIILLLCCPVTVRLRWKGQLEMGVFWLHFCIWKKNKEQNAKKIARKAKKNADRKPQQEAKKEKKQDLAQVFLQQAELLSGMLGSACAALQAVLRSVRVPNLQLHIRVAGKDAAQTAISYGRAQAVLGAAYATLANLLRIEQVVWDVEPDFLADFGSADLQAVLCVRPLAVLGAALRFAVHFLWTVCKKNRATPGTTTEKAAENATKTQEG